MEEKNKLNKLSNFTRTIYNIQVKQARNGCFSKLISDSKNNPRILFAPVDHLINSDFN